jgi:hypothetical protein
MGRLYDRTTVNTKTTMSQKNLGMKGVDQLGGESQEMWCALCLPCRPCLRAACQTKLAGPELRQRLTDDTVVKLNTASDCQLEATDLSLDVVASQPDVGVAKLNVSPVIDHSGTH